MIRILKYGEVANKDIFARVIPTFNVEEIVADIIANVREKGDSALLEYTAKFDGATLDAIAVSAEEIDEAVAEVEPRFLEVLEKAAVNIKKFHEKQRRNSFIINDEDGIVVYCSSFSKILSAGMRVGFVCAPDKLVQKMVVAKQCEDVHTNILFQMLCHRYMTERDMDGHIAGIRALYREKCNLMLDCLDAHMPTNISKGRTSIIS